MIHFLGMFNQLSSPKNRSVKLTYIGQEILDNLSRKEVVDFINSNALPHSSQKVLDTLKAFMGPTEGQDISNVDLQEVDLSKISNSDYFKARRTIRNLSGNEINAENPAAYGYYLWLCGVLDVKPSISESNKQEVKEETIPQVTSNKKKNGESRPENVQEEQEEVKHHSETQPKEEKHYGSEDPIIQDEPIEDQQQEESPERPEKFVRGTSSSSPTKYTLEREQSAHVQAGQKAWERLGKL